MSYIKDMGYLKSGGLQAPNYPGASNRPYTTNNSDGSRGFRYRESVSGWLFIQYVADNAGAPRNNTLTIDGTSFKFEQISGLNHYEDFVSYQVPIGAGSTWEFTFNGQRAVVTFVPST